eukprot:m.221701 g.221701  ORF g.221701 m.221701 type:complete len:88 (+) comp15866_c0_seq1:3267-3530(+)
MFFFLMPACLDVTLDFFLFCVVFLVKRVCSLEPSLWSFLASTSLSPLSFSLARSVCLVSLGSGGLGLTRACSIPLDLVSLLFSLFVN